MKAQTALEKMIGESAAMAKLRRTIGKVAARVHPVLIQGESGTGKELVARAIHAQSDRRDRRRGLRGTTADAGGKRVVRLRRRFYRRHACERRTDHDGRWWDAVPRRTAVESSTGTSLTNGSGSLSIAEAERRAIEHALQKAKNNKLEAARLLGIGKTTLYRKLKEYEK